MEYAPFKQKTNLMFGEVRTLNLHCGIEVAKQLMSRDNSTKRQLGTSAPKTAYHFFHRR